MFKILTEEKLKEAADAHALIMALQTEIREQEKLAKDFDVKIDVAKHKKEVKRLIDNREKVLSEVAAINNMRIKTAIVMKYFNNRTWRDIAQAIGKGDSEDAIRKAVQRYLNYEEGDNRCSKRVRRVGKSTKQTKRAHKKKKRSTENEKI